MTDKISLDSKKPVQVEVAQENATEKTAKKEEKTSVWTSSEQPATSTPEKKIAEVKSSFWEEAKAYARGFKEGFADYYAEKYEGTTGVGDALSRTNGILDEGFGMMDEYNPATYVKKPIKEWSADVAARISDGDPNNLSLAERSWAALEGVGSIADNLTSAKGITYTCLTAGTVGAAVGAIAGTSATAAATVKVGTTVAGEVLGTTLIAKGGYDVVTADTEAEAKKGGAELGAGAIALAASAASAKDSIRTAQAAGIETKNPYALSTPEAMVENIRILPKVVVAEGKEVATATKSLVASLTGAKSANGIIKAGSPELQDAIPYMSKANDVQAYRFNPNGTPEEVLANNPGVYMKDGKYYLPNKWDANNPYLIDTSKDQMIMLYGGDDMAVCDGAVFKGSYVDTAGFKASGNLSYQDPATLEYGKVVNVTKQAPGAFKEMPVGTKVETLEGMRTVGEGEVVAVDHAGNPYVTPLKNITKRNIPVDTPASKEAFAQVQHTLDNGFKVKPELRAEFDKIVADMAADTKPCGWNDGLSDMKKIMTGLEKLTLKGNMTTQGYAELAQTIDADLPGCYWSKALQLYTKYGTNANTPQVINAAQGYLSGVTTVNGCSNLYRAQSAPSATEYTALAASTVATASDNSGTSNISSALEDIKPVVPKFAE